MKKFISGCIVGGIICATVSAIATNYIVNPNPYPVKVNGNDVSIEGYNINDNTYFKLRDVGEEVGFRVDFANDIIFVNTLSAPAPTASPAPTIAPLSVPLPELPTVEVEGVECVSVLKISRMLYDLGMGDYYISEGNFYNAENKILLSGISYIGNMHIPLDFYNNTLVPLINSLRE